MLCWLTSRLNLVDMYWYDCDDNDSSPFSVNYSFSCSQFNSYQGKLHNYLTNLHLKDQILIKNIRKKVLQKKSAPLLNILGTHTETNLKIFVFVFLNLAITILYAMIHAFHWKCISNLTTWFDHLIFIGTRNGQNYKD